MALLKPWLFADDRLAVLSVGDDFQLTELATYLQTLFELARYRDVLYLQLSAGEAWLFSYGVIIFWGAEKAARESLLSEVQAYISGAAVRVEVEVFRFSLEAERSGVVQDMISLRSDDRLQRLAVSHALAQSIKLNLFEERAQLMIQSTAHIPRSLARTGRITLSGRQTAKLRGELFSAKSDIILKYGLLDTPEFFWENPEYQPVYEPVSRYLEIEPRVILLSQKLEAIHELLEMLADERKHQHSSRLEWIIIILIAIEIVYFVIHG